jgi:glycine hydroxymethyltransferase
MPGFFLTDPLSKIDPDVEQIIAQEAARQKQKLIFIPSESVAPFAIRESLGSILQNFYAEGYPDEETRTFTQEEIMDFDQQLAHFRRFSDPRFYKGVEFADVLEELARRRCAELFAANGLTADDIFVNVQSLSGAPANSAVYHALIEPVT